MPATPELIAWTHDALESLYDMAFLERHARDPRAEGRFASGRMLHGEIQQAVKQLRPPLTVPEHSPALRVYNVLNLRYVQGLSQAEAASELNLSVRHFKREQERSIQAVAALLFEQPAPGGVPAAPDAPALLNPEFVRADELLRLSLNLVEPLLQRQDLHVKVSMPPTLPPARGNRLVARQLLISALSWLVHGVQGRALEVGVAAEKGHVVLRLHKPSLAAGDEIDAPDELATTRSLAAELGARADLSRGAAGGPWTLELKLPVTETRCVLMIEDNADAIELVRRYLDQSGEYHLVALSHPEEALRQAVLLQPACILLDIMMPERDGWDLLTLLKADPQTAPIPVIISSVVRGYDLAYALGAVEVLPKPFSAAQLIATLRSATGRGSQSPAPRSA